MKNMSMLPRFSLRIFAMAALALAAGLAHAQTFSADYRIAPAFHIANDALGPGLSLQGGQNWFGQLGVSQAPASPLTHTSGSDVMNVAGGYRWSNGQTLSLQVSRGRGPGQRLGLAVNYDWPNYFLRFSYDPPSLTLSPQDSLRFSAGFRF